MIQAIERLRKLVDDDGTLTLDRDQTLFFFFWLYALADGDGSSVKFAELDLMGTLPSGNEEVSA